MGIKKSKGKKSSGLGSKLKGVAKKAIGIGSSGGKRRSRVTPERLARKLLILKLQRKIYRIKYGGR